jgi:hypothetical protein
MTDCLICKTSINDEVKQFGDAKKPICESCYLDGGEWVYQEPEIVYALERGASLEEAKKIVVQRSISDLEKFAMNYFSIMFEVMK